MHTTYEAHDVRTGLVFGESPRWHDGRLWYSDFYRHGVFSLGEGDERRELTVQTQPSGLGWMPDGSLLCVSMTDHRVLRVGADGTQAVHAEIAEHCGYWANDMVVAADGTAYVGNFGFHLDEWIAEVGIEGVLTPGLAPTTNLIVLSAQGETIQVVPEMCFPNGAVLSEDGRTLIVAETMAQRLSAFDVASDGTLSGRRVFAQLSLVFPDGICLDERGGVWVANGATPECLRVEEGGEVTARVATSQPSYACMLGGEGRRTLFVMTAPTSTTTQLVGTSAGKVEAALVEFAGAGLP